MWRKWLGATAFFGLMRPGHSFHGTTVVTHHSNRQACYSPLWMLPIPSDSPLIQSDQAIHIDPPVTTALLKISYDGGRFTGWSSANDEGSGRAGQSKSNKALRTGFVRSIQGSIQDCLSRLYGNLPVVVEGCSRTDKGVHARGMVAQFYCVDPSLFDMDDAEKIDMMLPFSIPGKKQPHPWNATDGSYFKPLPTTDLGSIQYKLNRMLPSDVRIVGIASLPSATMSSVFHPTLSSTSKTYEYSLSVGDLHDPTRWRTTWHVGDKSLDISAMQAVCRDVLVGSHDFGAFQGAPRSADDKTKQATKSPVCRIHEITIREDLASSWLDTTKVYTISVTGDRFLYKMMRFLVGALVSVGQHKLSAEEIQQALQSGTREDLPPFQCAPAKGLVLAGVQYDELVINWL